MKRKYPWFLGSVATLSILLGAACGGDDADPAGSPGPSTPGEGTIQAFITSSDLAVGQQRFAFVLLEDDIPVRAESVAVRFFKLKDESSPQLVGEGTIPWMSLGIDGLTSSTAELDGIYFANIEFDEAGKWGAGFTVGSVSDPAKEVRIQFEVKAETSTVGVGDEAISVDSPTLRTAELKQIDTSPEPDEAFHQVSIAEALESGKPAVIAFTTPAFCESRTCGPTMEILKAAYERYGDDFNWIHVEPFELDEDGVLVLRNGQRVNADAANTWRLPSEPWVFVVDAEGTVVARYDGPLALDELAYALGPLSGQPARQP